MSSVQAKKGDTRSTLEMRTTFGKSGEEYLLVKVRRRGADHLNAFAACELKGANLDILGRDDSKENRREHADKLAVQAWKVS